MSEILLTEQAAPANPGAGKHAVYVGADGEMTIKDSAGVETRLASLTGFAINVWNSAKSFKSLLSFAGLTADRSHALPDKDGTVALTSDFAAPGPIGGTTPAAVSATTLTASGALTTAGLKEDAAGNLGLGVVPSAWTGFAPAIQLQNGVSLSTYAATNLSYVSTNATYSGGDWKFNLAAANYASRYAQQNGMHYWNTSTATGTAGAAITWNQAMTLDSAGNLLVGTGSANNAPANGVQLWGSTAQATSGGMIAVGHVAAASTGTHYQTFAYNGGIIGSITQSGTTAVAYNTTSDHRLKENVRPANAARFMDIEFVDFEWVDGRHDCGVIAGQLQSVYPDLVIGAVDATEVRTVEITPVVPAVTEQREVSPAVPAEYITVTSDELVLVDGVETTITRSKLVETKAAIAAVSETVEITPAVPAVTEDQTFPVYQQVNYMGLIGRMGTRVQQLQRTVDAQAALLAAMEARLTTLEAA